MDDRSLRADPELAAIVLSVANQPGLVDAVRSLCAQDEALEIVVVNSGGGGAERSLRQAGLQVTVVEREAILWPGAARNVGIAATRAPLVAFLAGDCLAEPGWAAARLRAHRGGARAVAGAVTNAQRASICAWAYHVLLYARRMPGTPRRECLLYSVSYDRKLFRRYGLFREDLRTGEDTDFNKRLKGRVPIAWNPEVRTAHRNPTRFREFLRDLRDRGARRAATLGRLDLGAKAKIVRNVCKRLPRLVRLSWRAADPVDRRRMLLSFLLTPVGTAAYLIGIVTFRDGSAPAKRRWVQTGLPRILRRDARIIGLLAFRNEMRYLPGYFENVAPHVDGIVALDDGSTDGSAEFVESQPAVLELIRRPSAEAHTWDDAANHRLLVETAWKHDPGWLLGVDADERLERRFRRRAQRVIRRAEGRGHLAYSIRMLSLWDAHDTVRVDGAYGRARVARFFQARRDHEFHSQRLHGHWAPLNSAAETSFHEADLIIYHLRMTHRADRLARHAKYVAIDPHNEHQPRGYTHLIDEEGVRLEPLPRGRGYGPVQA